MHLPADYQKLMKERLQDDYFNYLKSFEQTIGQTFRVNHLKAEPAKLLRRLNAVLGDCHFHSVEWCEAGFYYDGNCRLSRLPWYQAGLYYLQEPSAMAPAAFLPVKPGEKVLDLCAAPGGKTTALAAKLSGKGLLVANDISISRCKALLKNVQMAGISNVMITCETPERLAEHFPGYFDKILVDAPCSGEGMFRRDPSMMKTWSLSEVKRYSRLQKEIMSYAAAMLKPGGCILYSTCTYSPEENEQVVEVLLKEDAFTLLPLPDYHGVDSGHPEWSVSKDSSLSYCRRFWNHRVEGEGQFAALLKKSEKSPEDDKSINEEAYKNLAGSAKAMTEGRTGRRKKINKKGRGKNDQKSDEKSKDGFPEDLKKYLHWIFSSETDKPTDISDSSYSPEARLMRKEERIFLLPPKAPDMSGLRVLSSGLYLGDVKKHRFEPSAALALALGADRFDNVLTFPPDAEELERYLKGESLDIAFKEKNQEGNAGPGEKQNPVREGWCLVCVDEYPLGWGKVQGNRVKNKYPPGWIHST